MAKKLTILQAVAWFYALMFLGVFIISHWPGLTDASGKLLGLYKIDPIDDIFHLLSGIYGAIAAWHSARWSRTFFLVVSFLFGVDALMGLFISREFLNPTFITKGFGSPDFSLSNWLVNLPHVAIAVVGLFVVYALPSSKRDAAKS